MRIDVNGSFIGSTASGIRFNDGIEFSSANPTPLLTMSVPIGLQFGANPGPIQVQGGGHKLTASIPLFAPYTPTSLLPTGLQVKLGNTLALVGGEVKLTGGTLTAPQGRIELGSVGGAGQVQLTTLNRGFALDYSKAATLQNIQLSQRALLDVSGVTTAGAVQVQGNQISLKEGSLIFSQNRGAQTSGNIDIRATELLTLSGTTVDESVSSGILSETVLAGGALGNTTIETKGLLLENGAVIGQRSFTPFPTGTITVTAKDFVQMQGSSPNRGVINTIVASTFYQSPNSTIAAQAKAGDITVSTERLSMKDASFIASTTFGDGSGGKILVNTDTAELIGGGKNDFVLGGGYLTSTLSAVAYRRGNAGSITLNARTVSLLNGARISSTSGGTGNAGNVVVNARESLTMKGIFEYSGDYISPSISSTVRTLIETVQAAANAGSVTITAPLVMLDDEAFVAVSNDTVGNAGNLSINANTIQLKNRAAIAATTQSGAGGNIAIAAQNLLLRNGARIATDAGKAGNGGNITINSDLITAIANSDITANSGAEKGGKITIATQGIFGTAYRLQQTPESDITATGGINGVVEINMPGINPIQNQTELPSGLINSDQRVANACTNQQGSRFVSTGKGGIPANPTDGFLSRDRPWIDTRNLASNQEAPIIEATALRRNAAGKVELIATCS
jgi:large exoprotein involved in heme utilization and adhesion